MRIGIISDSHDDVDAVRMAVKEFNKRQIYYVLHAGDIISPETLSEFSKLEAAKFIGVFGNVDTDHKRLSEAAAKFGGRMYDMYIGNIFGRTIFMVHQPDIIPCLAATGNYDLIIYGHTHLCDMHKEGKTLIFNPGESTPRLGNEPSIWTLDLADFSYECISLKMI